MLSKTIDYTSGFNSSGFVTEDVGQWQNITIHIDGTVTGTLAVLGTNDGGAIQGVSDGNGVSSKNYTALRATDLSTGTAATTITAAGNYTLPVTTRYFRLGVIGGSTTGNLIIILSTPV